MDRAKRVRRLKKIMIAVIVTAILLPTVLCIVLLFRMSALERRMDEMLTWRQNVAAAQAEEKRASASAAAQTWRSVPDQASASEEQSVAVTGDARRIYLTFDDGPSIYTEEILDILKEYEVKATFFVVGREDKHSLEMYKRIVEEGHTLGMHSYSHKYSEIYASREAYAQDMERLSDLLYRTTGVRPKVCRFPGGSSNQVSSVDMQELFDWLAEQGLTYYDWNVSSGDASSGRLSADEIVRNCTADLESYHRAMILMHDAADKHTTVEALPIIIEYGLGMENTVFLPVTDDTAPIQHKKDT